MPDINPLYEGFCAGPLGAWSDDKSQACDIARETVFRAVVEHGKARGTVLVTCPASLGREVMGYIESFFESADRLSEIRPKFKSDEVTVGRVRMLILPTGSPRRPRSILWRTDIIDVAPAALPSRTDLSHAEKVARLQHVLLSAMLDPAPLDEGGRRLFSALDKAHGGTGEDPDAFRARCLEDYRNYHVERRAEVEQVYDDFQGTSGNTFDDLRKFMTPTSVPSVPRAPQTREELITSPQFEYERALNMGKNQPSYEPVLSGPRGWKR